MSTSLNTTFVIPAYNSCLRLGKQSFLLNLHRIKTELYRHTSRSKVLVVDNSTAKDNGQTRKAAQEAYAEVISVPPISAGYARFRGIDYAFNNFGSDLVIMGDDDLHILPEAIPRFMVGIKSGADLALGVRSLKDRLSHPLWQYALEEMVNLYATHRLAIKPNGANSSALWTDFISGGQAFSRSGWREFRKFVSEADMEQLGHATTFFPGVFRALGLKVVPVEVAGPYEGNYWRDSFSFSALIKRVKTISRDVQDIEAARKYFLTHGSN